MAVPPDLDFITKQDLGIVAGCLLGGIVILLILIIVLFYMIHKMKQQIPQSIPPTDQRYVPTPPPISDRFSNFPMRNPLPDNQNDRFKQPNSFVGDGPKKFDTRPQQPAQNFLARQSPDLDHMNYSQYDNNSNNQNYGGRQQSGLHIPRPTANSGGGVNADYYGGRVDNKYY